MKSKRILVIGATGNIGREVIKYLFNNKNNHEVFAAVRNIDKASYEFEDYQQLKYLKFDFEDISTFDSALDNIDSVFLLRPPHISDVEKYFRPLISKIKEKKINQIVFLSVQGVESSKIIPHNKIEKMIVDSGIDYIFLRPSYFMQNLITTLHKDILEKQKIILPSGYAKFNWIDIENIAELAAILLDDFDNFKNQGIDITGYENLDFFEITDLINKTIGTNIIFESVNPLKFYRIKRKDGLNRGLILVMIFLHFLPRLKSEPKISKFYENTCGKLPTNLKEFILRESDKFKK